MKDIIAGILAPLVGIFTKREERKKAKEAATAKLAAAKVEGAQEVLLNKDEYEIVATQGLAGTWKDEYITVSVVSILNIVVLGGILSAFGYPQMLEGVVTAVTALVAIGVDVGFIMTATIMAGIGLSVWKKF